MGWGTLIPLAISAIGSGLSIAANSEEQGAANKAAEGEIAQQQQYAQQGKNAFEQSLSQSTPTAVKGQMSQGERAALQGYGALNALQIPGASTSTGNNPIPEQAKATEDAQIGAQVGQQNRASAALQGYTSSDVAQYIKDLQAKTQLGQIGEFAQGSENTLQAQLQQALQSQDTLAGIGSLLSSVGGLGAIYGAVNKPASSFASGYSGMPGPIGANLY